MEHINIEIKGKFKQYIKLTAESGYCFYDKTNEERNYLTSEFTPLITEYEIGNTYVVVKGNADELNEQLQRERQEKESANGDI